jgi:hypothetical protein
MIFGSSISMSTVRPEPVEASFERAEWGHFDRALLSEVEGLSMSELANKSGRINNNDTVGGDAA